MGPIGPSQIQNVSVADIHDGDVVTRAGLTKALVPLPGLLEVARSVQCRKRVL